MLLKFSSLTEAESWVVTYPKPRGLVLISGKLYTYENNSFVEIIGNSVGDTGNLSLAFSTYVSEQSVIHVDGLNYINLPLDEYEILHIDELLIMYTNYSYRLVSYIRVEDTLQIQGIEGIDGSGLIVAVKFMGQKLNEEGSSMLESGVVIKENIAERDSLVPPPIGIIYIRDATTDSEFTIPNGGAYYHWVEDKFNLVARQYPIAIDPRVSVVSNITLSINKVDDIYYSNLPENRVFKGLADLLGYIVTDANVSIEPIELNDINNTIQFKGIDDRYIGQSVIVKMNELVSI